MSIVIQRLTKLKNMKKTDIEHLVETTVETVKGYPVKNLVLHEKRKYIGGHIKLPNKGNPLIHNGYIGMSWFLDGEAMPQYSKFGTRKTKGDLKLKKVENKLCNPISFPIFVSKMTRDTRSLKQNSTKTKNHGEINLSSN